MLQGLYFGAKLRHRSSVDGELRRCLFVREEDGKAIVLFYGKDTVSKVDFVQLMWGE